MQDSTEDYSSQQQKGLKLHLASDIQHYHFRIPTFGLFLFSPLHELPQG